MLFAKDLKVALAAVIAAVGLLGFNMAHATVYITPDDSEGSTEISKVVYFAAEAYHALPTGTDADAGKSVTASSTTDFAVIDNSIEVLMDANFSYFLRLELFGPGCDRMTGDGCPQFGADVPVPTVTGEDTDGNAVTTGDIAVVRAQAGRDGDYYGIWRLRVADDEGFAAGGWNVSFALKTTEADPDDDVGVLRLPRNLYPAPAMGEDPDPPAEKCFSVELSVWDQFGEARENRAEALVKNDAGLVCTTPTVSASFRDPQDLTASVAAIFRRFTGATPTMGTLATAVIDEPDFNAGTTEAPNTVLNPADGSPATLADVLDRVDYTFSGTFSTGGPFSFGEFYLGAGASLPPLSRFDADGEPITSAAAKTTDGLLDTNTVVGSVSTVGGHPFRVDVTANDVGDETNPYTQIGAGTYSVTWQVVWPGEAAATSGWRTPEGMLPLGNVLDAGMIMRDGTSVRVGYLTTATDFGTTGDQSYNQRLVISNHGSVDAVVTLGDFVVEEGAEAPTPVNISVPANTAVVRRVAKDEADPMDNGLISIGGCRVELDDDGNCLNPHTRAAATLTATVREGDISVFTTTVTRPEGQTDTVRYWPLQ